MCVYIYIYIYIYSQMVDFCKSDRMRNIRGKVNRTNTDNRLSNDISSKYYGLSLPLIFLIYIYICIYIYIYIYMH